MEFYVPLLPLAVAACVAASPPPGGQPMTQIACALEGEELAGISSDSACEIFRDALADTSEVAIRIELAAVARDRARAIVRDGSGAVLADMEHAVMDAALNPAAWENFARAVAFELSRTQAG